MKAIKFLNMVFDKHTPEQNRLIFTKVKENLKTIGACYKFSLLKSNSQKYFIYTTLLMLSLIFVFGFPIWSFFIPLFFYLAFGLLHIVDLLIITKSLYKAKNILYENHGLNLSIEELFIYAFVLFDESSFNENDFF